MSLSSINRLKTVDSDDEPQIEELRYKEILDIPYSTIYFDRIFRYCSAINCKVVDSKAIYLIHLILTIIQVISPCLLLSSTILWKEDSIVSFVLNIIFSIAHGWHLDSDDDFPRRIITIVCTCIFILSIIFVMFRIFLYNKRKVVTTIDSNILYVYKYLLPHLLPLLTCGFPASIRCLAHHQYNFLNYANAILPPFILVYELFIIRFMSERILIENHPSFTFDARWLPTLFFLISINSSIDCAIIQNESGSYRIALLCIMLILYLMQGILSSILLPHLSLFYSYFISALCLSCSCVVFLNIFFLEFNIQIDLLSLIFLIILCFAFYLMNAFFGNKQLTKYTQIFYDLADIIDDDHKLFNTTFTSRTMFIRAIHICFPTWHPYLLTWEPFRLAMLKWPEDEQIYLLWIKLVAIFPLEFDRFKKISTQFQQNPKFSLVNRLQLRYIIHSNTKELIPSLSAFIDSFEQSSKYLKQMHQYFFGNILTKKSLLFWPNVIEISEQVNNHYLAINELLDEFPNNIEIVHAYCKFLDTFKINPKELNSWKLKLQKLYSGQKLKTDMAYTAALKAYPQLADLCNESEEIGITEPEESEIDLDTDDELQFELTDKIANSKIGGIIIPSIISLIGTILVLVFFNLLIVDYQKNTINRYLDIVMTDIDMNDMILSFARFGSFSSHAVLILFDYFNITEEIKYLAPSFYTIYDAIPTWTFDIDTVIALGNRTLASIENLHDDFSLFEKNLEYNNGLFCNESFAYSMINITNNMIKELNESPEPLLVENDNYKQLISFFFDDFKKLYEIAHNLKSNMIYSVQGSMSSVNNYMVGTILLDILLVTTPFVLCYFSFGLISDAIFRTFSSLPSSAIRETIQMFDDHHNSASNHSKYSSRQLSSYNGRFITVSKLMLIIPSILSFIFLIIGSYVIYFSALSVSDKGANYVKILEDVTFPISSLYVISMFYAEIYNEQFIFYDNPDIFIEKGIDYIDITNRLLQNGLFSNGSTPSIIIDHPPKEIRYDVPKDLSYTDLEKLLLNDFLFSIDHLLALFQYSYLNIDDLWEWDSRFMQLSYYFTTYAMDYREDPYIDSLKNTVDNYFDEKEKVILPIAIFVNVVQILILILLIYVLYSRKKLLCDSLKFFMFINPETILQNQSIISLITQGKVEPEEKKKSAFNSKQVLLKIPESIVLIDSNLVIYDYNKSFDELISLGDITGLKLSDVMLYSNKTDFNIDHLKMKLNGMLNGNDEPYFQLSFSFTKPDSKILYVLANIVCLNDHGPILKQNEYKEITTIAIIMTDLTKTMDYKDQIQTEHRRIQKLLKKSMPEEIIELVEHGSDHASFSVQSLTYGCVLILTDPFQSNEEAPTEFFYKLFSIFDSYIKNYPLLTKIQINMPVYIFAGGIFEGKNSPENQAKEAVRFALSLLDIQHQLENTMQRRISLKIGISNGGPAIFGFLSSDRPNFHMIGDVVDVAQDLVSSALPGKIHISSSLHDLIYQYQFNIQECDEMLLLNGKETKTFFVTS